MSVFIACLAVALILGAWRTTHFLNSMASERNAGNYLILKWWRSIHELPEGGMQSRAWSCSAVRWGTWVVVAVASLWVAFGLAAVTAAHLGETAGLFSVGVWLVVRWDASVLLAMFWAIWAHKFRSSRIARKN